MTTNSIVTRRRRSVSSLVVGVVAAVAIAGCGSGSDSSGGSGSGSGGGKNDVAGAKAAVAQYKKRPDDFGIRTPIAKPVSSGKDVIYIHCGVPVCNAYADATADAAKVLGWRARTLTTNGTPESIQRAWQTAVRARPDAVISSGWDTTAYAAQLKQLKAQNVPVFNYSTTDPGKTGNVTARIGDSAAIAESGKMLAAWIVADTGGQANTLFVDVPAYTVLKDMRATFDRSYKTWCGSCGLDHLELPITALAKDSPQRIVSYLRAHPKVNYVAFSTDSGSIGLPAALRAAGLSGKVKFAGAAGNAQNLQYVKNGQETATINQGYYEEIFALMDSAARTLAGEPLDEIFDWKVPFWIDSRDTVTATDRISAVAPDIEGQAAKLWGAGR